MSAVAEIRPHSGTGGRALRWISRRSWAGLVAIALVGFGQSASAQITLNQVRTEITRLLNRGNSYAAGHRIDSASLRPWYARQNYRPAWVGSAANRQKAHALVDILTNADQDGLTPSDYSVDALQSGLWANTAQGIAMFDVALSNELLRYVRHLRSGKVPPHAVGANLEPPGAYISGSTVLTGAHNAASIERYLQNLTPSNPVYRGLKEMLAHYRTIALTGSWPIVAPGPTLNPGGSDRRVPTLRQRLSISGDLTGPASGSTAYGGALVAAVQRFQARHGLKADGVLGPDTVQALNVPVQARIEQIRVNMERWRWMPDNLGERYIIVNLAGFEARVVEHGRDILDMAVVVGKPYRETPIFTDTMTHMEFNPTWSIPPTIVEKDILPKVRRDPGYLKSRNIRVLTGWEPGSKELDPYKINWSRLDGHDFPYLLREDPGPRNPLGRVKFMFPNKYAIYLHDTPSRELFQKTVRTFSSGCIRVEKPIELALYLGQGIPGWGLEKIDSIIASKRTQEVPLPDPIPIYITYSTAWMAPDGAMNFRDDIYERDAVLARALGSGASG
jgi:murein L,D-transpeptidase YcbB/YkuD